MQSGIYLIKCLINGKIYVGSAVNLKKRQYEHKCRLRRSEHHNEYLQRAWCKYGEENFQFETIEFCNKDQLIEREQFWIDWLKATDENKGYNLCKIGRSALGRKHSPETIEKIRLGNLGKKQPIEAVEKMRLALTGRKRDPELMRRLAAKRKGYSPSEETREKMRQSNLGQKRSEETKNKLRELYKGKGLGKNANVIIELKISENSTQFYPKLKKVI